MKLTRRQAALDAFAHLQQVCTFADDGLKVLHKLIDYYAIRYGAQDPSMAETNWAPIAPSLFHCVHLRLSTPVVAKTEWE